MIEDLHALFVQPPGWDPTIGGPYLAGPLLSGFLKDNGFRAETIDLNIKVANHFNDKITEDEAVAACKTPSHESMNQVYFRRQDKLSAIAENWDGHWDLKYGFQFNDVDQTDPHSVLQAAKREAPYSELVNTILAEKIKFHNPSVIGISITVPTQLVPAFHIASLIKSNHSDIIILLGGNLPTRLMEEMKLEAVFDFVDGYVGFGGELAVLEVLQKLDDECDWKSASNMVAMHNGEIIQTQYKHPGKSDFSMPIFNGINLSEYWGCRYLPAVMSRGCYYGKCSFCAIPFSWGPDGFLGNDEPRKIVDYLLEQSNKTGIRRWKFIEEALHPGMVRKLSNILLDRDEKIEWEGYARLDSPWVSNGLLPLAAKAGLKKLYVGLELIPSAGRDLLNKKDSLDPLMFLKSCAKEGIKVHVFTMVGPPGSSHTESVETLRFALDNGSLIDTLDSAVFEYAKHTQMEGVERVFKQGSWELSSAFVPLKASIMTMDECEKLGEAIESKLWTLQSKWLHPIYRMVSPWS